MSTALLALLLHLALPSNMSLPQQFESAQFIAQSWSCTPRKTCSRIGTCEEAEWYLKNCAWGYKLDGDSDGVPCETICGTSH